METGVQPSAVDRRTWGSCTMKHDHGQPFKAVGSDRDSSERSLAS